jgi:hypothetical protein
MSVKNTALLGKWLFKLLTKEGTWQNILKKEIYWLKGVIPGSLEARGFTFLG